MATSFSPNLYNPNQNPYILQGQPGTPYGSPGSVSPYGGFNPNAPENPVLDANGQPVIDPATGLPQTKNPTSPNTSTLGFTVTGNEANVNPNAPMEDIYAANRDTINTTGNLIGQEAGNQLGYYGGQQSDYADAERNALNQLATTPGYNSDQASAVMGDPNAAANTVNAGVQKEQGALDEYGRNLAGNLTQGQGWMGDAAGRYASGVGGAASGLGAGLTAAQSKFDPLDAAVNNKDLGFDPNGTQKQLTDQDVQNLVTSAGTTVGNQFQTAEDTLRRQSAASGNTSPAAEAALRQQLVTQEAATAGDTMTQAQIAALQAQQSRAQAIEAQREGAVQTQTGLKATAATTEEAAAQAAAAQAGQSNINAQEAIGANTQGVANAAAQQNINAANTYGQFNVGQQTTQTGQQYGAQSAADQLASQRAGKVADTSLAGQAAYRSGVAGEQGAAQQGGQQAVQEQLGAYGTQTSGGNAAASSQAGFETSKASLGDNLAHSVANLFGEGGVADQDMVAKVGEKGPEWVGPLNAVQRENVRGRYKPARRDEDMDMFGVAA